MVMRLHCHVNALSHSKTRSPLYPGCQSIVHPDYAPSFSLHIRAAHSTQYKGLTAFARCANGAVVRKDYGTTIGTSHLIVTMATGRYQKWRAKWVRQYRASHVRRYPCSKCNSIFNL